MDAKALTPEQSKLAADNVKLVYAAVNTYCRFQVAQLRASRGWDKDECTSFLWPTYIEAIAKYDPEKGELSTFVVSCLRNAINRECEREVREFAVCRIPVQAPEAPEPDSVREETRDNLSDTFASLLYLLTPRERGLIEALYFSGDDPLPNVEDAAKRIGVSRNRGYQLRNSAFAKLRQSVPQSALDALGD